MIAKLVKMIAPVAIVALAVSAPAIAKDKPKNPEKNAPAVEDSQSAAGETTAGSHDAEEKVVEITIPEKGKDTSKDDDANKNDNDNAKSAKSKKDDDKQKSAKKDKKKDNG